MDRDDPAHRRGETLRRPRPLDREPEIVSADLLEPDSLAPALEGCEVAYYLVHSMGGRSIAETEAFVDRDRRCAENFLRAADKAGVGRIVYLGGSAKRAAASPATSPAGRRSPGSCRAVRSRRRSCAPR